MSGPRHDSLAGGRGPATSPPPSPPSARSEPRPQEGPVRRRKRPLGWGIVLIVLGILWLLALADAQVRWELLLPAVIVLVGVLVLAAGRWWSVDGLVGLGLVLSVIALTLPFSSGPWSLSAGERTHAPSEVVEISGQHALGAGSLTFDLRELDLTDGVTDLTARVGVGELIVRVPEGVTVTGTTVVAIGENTTLGHTRGGFAARLRLEDAPTAGPVLDLDLGVGIGRIEVVR